MSKIEVSFESNQPVIVLVDDEVELAEVVAEELEQSYKVFKFNNPKLAIEAIQNKTVTPSVIVTDLMMPQMTGLEMLHELSLKDIQIPTILFSGYLEKESLKKAIELGVIHTIEKPVDMTLLMEMVDRTVIDADLLRTRLEIKKTIKLIMEIYSGFRIVFATQTPRDIGEKILKMPVSTRPGLASFTFEQLMDKLEKRLDDLVTEESLLSQQKMDKYKMDFKRKSA